MFTGIVEEIGIIRSVAKNKDGLKLDIEGNLIFNDLKVNDSISCSGICLTVIEIKDNINKITDNFGVDLVVDCSGVAEGFGIALDLIREGGMLLEVGIFSNSHEILINPHSQILEKSARVIGVGGDDISQYYPSIKLLDRTIDKLPWGKIISHNFSIDNIHEAMNTAMSDKSMKVLVNP